MGSAEYTTDRTKAPALYKGFQNDDLLFGRLTLMPMPARADADSRQLTPTRSDSLQLAPAHSAPLAKAYQG